LSNFPLPIAAPIPAHPVAYALDEMRPPGATAETAGAS
jgi:hypothetical protein